MTFTALSFSLLHYHTSSRRCLQYGEQYTRGARDTQERLAQDSMQAEASPKPRKLLRSVTHKHVSPEILRSVSSRHVSKHMGRLLRGGFAADAATFELSEPCTSLDVFLSHSWRDSGTLKYLALCLYFNVWLATFAGLGAGLLTLLAQRYLGLIILPFTPIKSFLFDMHELTVGMGLDPQIAPPSATLIYSPTCQLVATTTFVLVFLFGHWLVRPARLFLDKICIHQCDSEKKCAGIRAVDQFILRSETMLILYNDDYFERLWCCFELAAAGIIRPSSAHDAALACAVPGFRCGRHHRRAHCRVRRPPPRPV